MIRFNKRIVLALLVTLTVLIFQIQSVLAVTELDSITFTAYHLGGSEDDMNYGTESEWGRGAMVFHGDTVNSTKNVPAADNMTIRFSVNQECQPFYCIEIGGHLDAVNGSEYSKSKGSYWAGKDNGIIDGDTMRQHIGAILYQGFHDEFTYQNNNMWDVNYDDNADKIDRYVATQILIWETIYGYRDENFSYVSWDGLNCPLDVISGVPSEASIRRYYNSFVDSIIYWKQIPSFMFSELEEAKLHPYKVPFDYKQGLYSTSMYDSNGRLSGFGYGVSNGPLYFDNNGSSKNITISLPKNTTTTKENPAILMIDPNTAKYIYSDPVVWSCSFKQNGVTWGTEDSYPQKGFAAFYGSDHHEAEKGSIKIIKKGEAFTGTEKVQAGEYELTVPVYSEYTLKDIEFTLTAKEDIYYDFDLLYKKGTVIASQKTDENGVIEFKDLGYGLYELKENAVEGNNYIEVTDPVEVKITYNSDNNTIEKIDKEFNNEYQKVRVGGMKSFEYVNPNLNIDLNIEMKQVLVGLYAAEDIRGQKDALLNKDTLIALAVPDSEGFFEFNCDLPSGNYYVRELKGSSNFSLDTNIHNVEAICDENEPITKKDSDNIVNKTGIIEGIKKDANGKTLANAVIGLFEDPDCTIEIDRKTTGEDGYFKFTDLPLNTYYVKEIEAPEGYNLNIKVFEVKAVEKDAEPIYISIINDEKPTPTPTTTTTTTTTTTESSEETVTETENYEALVITTETTETSETTLVTEITETTQSPKKVESKTQTKTITETGEEGSIIKTIGLSILYVAIIISVIGLCFGFIRMKKR